MVWVSRLDLKGASTTRVAFIELWKGEEQSLCEVTKRVRSFNIWEAQQWKDLRILQKTDCKGYDCWVQRAAKSSGAMKCVMVILLPGLGLWLLLQTSFCTAYNNVALLMPCTLICSMQIFFVQPSWGHWSLSTYNLFYAVLQKYSLTIKDLLCFSETPSLHHNSSIK